ncbi:hypothetical protein A8135_02520 [Legionella jamestowniensis]|uniref:DUF3592 domain-containing protein n=2 Tax=Legionella jamestowniensis TaxID=455 RepID=A0A0W0UIG2_9GAMM|nr:hypothetical protein Ljam_1690 [Legionella jamestowniensis]OCH97730.1 hypothetical protein A8135_02520 [Legionella jamestowniensis]SFM00870.1 Protein of unknown function [Legionella jamestowniensis DSM 19215]
MRSLTALLILASVATFLLAGYYFIEAWRITYNTVATKGQVVSFEVKPSQNNVARAEMLHYPVVRFKDKTGDTITAPARLGYYLHHYNIGDKVPVLYHSHDPKHVAIGNHIAIWMRFFLVFMAALFFTVIACITSLNRK